MQSVFQALTKQQQQMNDLMDRVDRLLDERRSTASDGDRVDYKFVGFVDFPQQDLQARDIVFPVPENTEFVAKSFAAYPFFRFITTDPATNGPDENTFRPCIFSSNEQSYLYDLTQDAASVDLFLSLSETYKDKNGKIRNRSYQNMPFPVEFLRTSSTNYRKGGYGRPHPTIVTRDDYYAGFEFPSVFLFDCDYVLPPGSNFRITVAPGFAGVREDPANVGADPTRQNEYRIVVVLDGYKKVRS